MTIQPGTGYTFTSSSMGTNFSIEQPWSELDSSDNLLQQFQIVVQPYTVGEYATGFSLIRVVKGDVIWCPKLLVVPGEEPPPICTTQVTIENWFSLPTFPIIDDANSAYIGDGGIIVPTTAGVEVGIYIFKATNLPEDYDPFIAALPDFTPSCPVTLPFPTPFEAATWEVIKIGSAVYIEPDPPVAGGWQITQKLIGSLTLPGDGNGGGETKKLPAQLEEGPGTVGNAAPFTCVITQVNGQRYLQIVTGSMTYSDSNMPVIYDGAYTHSKQAWFNKVQICPSGMRVNYNDIWPLPIPDPDPQFSNQIMEGGGGYMLPDANDSILLTAFKWDVIAPAPAPFNTGIINTGLPTLAIIAQSNTADFNKIDVDSGPSVYEQTMNVQAMTGYSADDFADDWGYCHTTWLNPRKLGYRNQTIATVIPTANTFACFVSVDQVGVTNVCNTILRISLVGVASGGGIVFSYIDPILGAVPSAIPFPVTDTYAPFYIESSNALALFTSLNAIPQLTGNVEVSGRNGTYFVTFINDLQGTSVAALTANISGVTAFTYNFEIIQYQVGAIDLTVPMQMGCTKLMNKEGITEADDPYNLNKGGSPAWKDIVNRADAINCTGFSGDVTTEGAYPMNGYTNQNPDFYTPDGCTGEICKHPFYVKTIKVGESVSYEVCSGTVNNTIPSNILDGFAGTGFLYIEATVDGTGETYPGTVTIGLAGSIPTSTDSVAYIGIAQITEEGVNQLVSSSLWTERFKCGEEDAKYWWSNV